MKSHFSKDNDIIWFLTGAQRTLVDFPKCDPSDSPYVRLFDEYLLARGDETDRKLEIENQSEKITSVTTSAALIKELVLESDVGISPDLEAETLSALRRMQERVIGHVEEASLVDLLDEGVEPWAVSAAAMNKLLADRGIFLPLLIIWPRAQKYAGEILDILASNFGASLIRIRIKVNPTANENLICIAYSKENWVKDRRSRANKLRDCLGDESCGYVTIVMLPQQSPAELTHLKKKMRGLWNNSF